MKPLLCCLTIYFSVFIPASLLAQVNTGDQAPGFTYTSLEGQEVSLTDFEGKVIYIFFYGAGCPHCIQNGPVTETDIYQPFMEDTNFVALGLDTWNYSKAANESFRSSTGISYSLLLNARQSLVDYYGNASAYDRSLVIGATGTIAYKGTGYVNTDEEQVAAAIEAELSKVVTSTESGSEFPETFSLSQNYPNPFNPVTSIRYTISAPGEVSLRVYNMLGSEITTLVNGQQSAGNFTVKWDASGLPSGIYIYRLQHGNKILTKRMTLIK